MRKLYFSLIFLCLISALVGCTPSNLDKTQASNPKETNEILPVSWAINEEATGNLLYNHYSSNIINNKLVYRNQNNLLVIHDLKSNKAYILNESITLSVDSFKMFHITESTLYAIKPTSGTSLKIMEIDLLSNVIHTYDIFHAEGEFIQAEYYNDRIVCFLSGYDNSEGGILIVKDNLLENTLKISEKYSLAQVPFPIIKQDTGLYFQLTEYVFYKLNDSDFSLSLTRPFGQYAHGCYWIDRGVISILDQNNNVIKQRVIPEPLKQYSEQLFLSDRMGDTFILGMKDGEKDHLYVLNKEDFSQIPDVKTISKDTSKFIEPNNILIFSSGDTLNLYDLNTTSIYPLETPIQPITYLHVTKTDDSVYRLVVLYDRTFSIYTLINSI